MIIYKNHVFRTLINHLKKKAIQEKVGVICCYPYKGFNGYIIPTVYLVYIKRIEKGFWNQLIYVVNVQEILFTSTHFSVFN